MNTMQQEQKAAIRSKNIKIAKRVLFGITFLLIVSLMVKGIDSFVKWSRENTIVFQSPVNIQFSKPVEIVKLAELNRRQAEKQMINDLTDIVFGIVLTPSQRSVDEVKKTVSENIDSNVFFDTIWQSESTKGKNNKPGSLAYYCESIGMWNEIGYGGMAMKFCFHDETEARKFIPYYVYKNGRGLSMSEMLCYYNEGVDKTTGKPRTSCPYSEGNLSLAN